MLEVVLPWAATFAVLFLALWLIWSLFVIIADMARERGRDPAGWVLLGLFWSPFGSMFLLWFVGDADTKESED